MTKRVIRPMDNPACQTMATVNVTKVRKLDQQQAYQKQKSTKQLLPMNQGHGSKTKATKGLFVKKKKLTTAQRQIDCSVLVYRRFP